MARVVSRLGRCVTRGVRRSRNALQGCLQVSRIGIPELWGVDIRWGHPSRQRSLPCIRRLLHALPVRRVETELGVGASGDGDWIDRTRRALVGWAERAGEVNIEGQQSSSGGGGAGVWILLEVGHDLLVSSLSGRRARRLPKIIRHAERYAVRGTPYQNVLIRGQIVDEAAYPSRVTATETGVGESGTVVRGRAGAVGRILPSGWGVGAAIDVRRAGRVAAGAEVRLPTRPTDRELHHEPKVVLLRKRRELSQRSPLVVSAVIRAPGIRRRGLWVSVVQIGRAHV